MQATIISLIANWLPVFVFGGLFVFWMWWLSRRQSAFNDLGQQNIKAARENTAALNETNELLRALLTKLDTQERQ